jgi:hypothetical protein
MSEFFLARELLIIYAYFTCESAYAKETTDDIKNNLKINKKKKIQSFRKEGEPFSYEDLIKIGSFVFDLAKKTADIEKYDSALLLSSLEKKPSQLQYRINSIFKTGFSVNTIKVAQDQILSLLLLTLGSHIQPLISRESLSSFEEKKNEFFQISPRKIFPFLEQIEERINAFLPEDMSRKTIGKIYYKKASSLLSKKKIRIISFFIDLPFLEEETMALREKYLHYFQTYQNLNHFFLFLKQNKLCKENNLETILKGTI